ncbi:MAG: NAD-dependent epimerase/dehydratase family protein [Candidatus Helarchaeota archaeon]
MPTIKTILITGGAGFIGSHLADALIEAGYSVRVLDNLSPQVHPTSPPPPSYLNEQVEFVKGDITDIHALSASIEGIDAIYHFAAAVGVGQSMYQINQYITVNTRGTALLLDLLVNKEHSVKKLIIASSMSIYGEGKYSCDSCGIVFPTERNIDSLKAKQWDFICPDCGQPLKPMPTDEKSQLHPTSIYAQSKRHQEEMTLLIGATYGIPTTALRFFNVYGSRQSLSNPYTGVCAIFSNRLQNNLAPIIYEDGLQSRDFIHIRDLVAANILCLEKSAADHQIFNVGTGQPTTILEIAQHLLHLFHLPLKPQITGHYRKGDIRHCFADITKIRKKLGFQPTISIKKGLHDLINWVLSQPKIENNFQMVDSELEKHGLKLK